MWAGFTHTPRGLCSVFFGVFVESGSVRCIAGIRPKMLVIMAGMDRRTVTRRDAAQRDTQSSSCRPRKASIVFYVRDGLVYKWYFLGRRLELAAAAADGVDAATLAFLTARALEDRWKEEQEEREKEKMENKEKEKAKVQTLRRFFWPGLHASRCSGAERLHRVR